MSLSMIHFRSRNNKQQNVYINGKFEGIITLTKVGKYNAISRVYRCPNTMKPLSEFWEKEVRKEAKKIFGEHK